MAWDRNGDLIKKKVAHWRCNGHTDTDALKLHSNLPSGNVT